MLDYLNAANGGFVDSKIRPFDSVQLWPHTEIHAGWMCSLLWQATQEILLTLFLNKSNLGMITLLFCLPIIRFCEHSLTYSNTKKAGYFLVLVLVLLNISKLWSNKYISCQQFKNKRTSGEKRLGFLRPKKSVCKCYNFNVNHFGAAAYQWKLKN